MKKFITILISCSLALAAGALAQQDEQPEKSPAAKEAKPAPKLQAVPKAHVEPKTTGQEKTLLKSESTPKAPVETKAPRLEKSTLKPESTTKPNVGAKTKGKESATTNAELNASPSATVTGQPPLRKGKNARSESATATKSASPTATIASKTASPAPTVANMQSPSPAASVSPAAAQANTANPQGGAKVKADAKKPDAQTVEKIKTEHANFKAQPRPDKVPAVTFNASFRINGADQWQGRQYQVFRSYHPERHDRGWYHTRYPRVELISGGYYYWNEGYWYPAWGYDNSAQYYAYDGPIYVGHQALPPDRVIADVQAVLQQMGYYQGEVDGLLGPLTRQALTGYQADHGLYGTATIDEPTLDSLGMG